MKRKNETNPIRSKRIERKIIAQTKAGIGVRRKRSVSIKRMVAGGSP
jgi:hypothetical protein